MGVAGIKLVVTFDAPTSAPARNPLQDSMMSVAAVSAATACSGWWRCLSCRMLVEEKSAVSPARYQSCQTGQAGLAITTHD